MATRFVLIDQNTPLLLPPNFARLGRAYHLVHLILDAVFALDLRRVKVNERGTGSEQYPPITAAGSALLIPVGRPATLPSGPARKEMDRSGRQKATP